MGLESKDKKFGIKRLYRSFLYAIEGFQYTVLHEQNMVIHILMAFLVIVAGLLFQISLTEWLICFLLIGLVMTAELINTSIEAVVDLVSPNYSPLAKIAKDTAASAVMVFSITALLAGVLIFGPKIIQILM